MLVKLIYASQVSPEVDNAAIRNILNKSQENNQRLGVTGALLFSGTVFLQCLEGSRSTVNALYNRILQDSRHAGSEILFLGETTRRDFISWDMGYMALTPENRALFLKYSARREFDPESMSSESACALFAELRDNASLLRQTA